MILYVQENLKECHGGDGSRGPVLERLRGQLMMSNVLESRTSIAHDGAGQLSKGWRKAAAHGGG